MSEKLIDGLLFQSMVIEGALAIAEKKEQANELNVFPVPDGDTGTNMSLTMGSAMAEMQRLNAPTLAKAVDATASSLLRGARGNSGCYSVPAVPRHGKKASRTHRSGRQRSRACSARGCGGCL